MTFRPIFSCRLAMVVTRSQLPVRSPTPLTVPWTWVAPASTAASASPTPPPGAARRDRVGLAGPPPGAVDCSLGVGSSGLDGRQRVRDPAPGVVVGVDADL